VHPDQINSRENHKWMKKLLHPFSMMTTRENTLEAISFA
jgi:hypothetical protein